VATRLCRRVHRLEIPVSADSQLLSISIGIAMRQDGDNVESLLERADQAMYDAKLNGRNRVCLYAERMSANTHSGPQLHVVETRER